MKEGEREIYSDSIEEEIERLVKERGRQREERERGERERDRPQINITKIVIATDQPNSFSKTKFISNQV